MEKDKLKEFILFIQDKTKVTSSELIEKDFYLNLLLSKLNLEEYAFKGGTCLAKVYLDYFRFSEDLDFTFINQTLFKNKSTNQIKKICKDKITHFGKQIESLGLDFVLNKSDRQYVELGNNNKLVTFKVGYNSLFTNTSSFIKIQINFLEDIKFKIKPQSTISLIKQGITKEEEIYFQEFITHYQNKEILVYDIREIVAEKIRSLLTRRAIKSRDAIDLFCISQKFKINPDELVKEAKDKISFACKSYEKYRENFMLAKQKLDKVDFTYNEVRYLVIKDIKKGEFESFIVQLIPLLQNIMGDIKE